MSEEVSIHQAPRTGGRRGLRPRTWLAITVAGALVLLSAGVTAVIQPLLSTARPDKMQLMAVSSNGGPNGQFAIRLRLSRADGYPLSASVSTTADLLDAQSGTQLLGKQCGFQVNQAPGRRWMEVTLLGSQPKGMTAPRRVRAKVEVQVMPAKDVLEFFVWSFSGRRSAQPNFNTGNWVRLTHDLDLPPSLPAVPKNQK